VLQQCGSLCDVLESGWFVCYVLQHSGSVSDVLKQCESVCDMVQQVGLYVTCYSRVPPYVMC